MKNIKKFISIRNIENDAEVNFLYSLEMMKKTSSALLSKFLKNHHILHLQRVEKYCNTCK